MKKTKEESNKEEYIVSGERVMERIKKLIKEGNVRRIRIKNEEGVTLVEIPLTIAVVGGVLAPVLAALGALTALLTKCSIVVERR